MKRARSSMGNPLGSPPNACSHEGRTPQAYQTQPANSRYLRGLQLLLAVSSGFVGSGALAQTAATNLPPPPEVPQVDENGVDIVSGSIASQRTFLSIGPDGPMGLRYEQIYANGGRTNLSSRMQHTVGQSVYAANAQIGQSGASMQGGVTLNGDYVDQGIYIMRDGTVATFGYVMFYNFPDPTTTETNSLITSLKHPNGVEWTFYHHGDTDIYGVPQARIQSVVSNTGYHLKITYKSDDIEDLHQGWMATDEIVAINSAFEYCDPLALSCSVAADWDKIQFSDGLVDPNGNVWRFPAQSSGQTGTIGFQSPLSATPEVQYSLSWLGKRECSPFTAGPATACPIESAFRVTSVSVNGVTSNYSYAAVNNDQIWRVTRTGPDGTTVFDSENGRPGVAKATDVLGRVSEFSHSLSGQLLSAEWPEGNRVEYVRDIRGNPTQTRYISKTGAISTVYQTFPSCGSPPDKVCNQPSSVTDANGNTTTYTYSADHGGVLTEVGPAVGGVSPAKKYSYVQRYAWVKNSGAGYVQASSPIWLLSEERTCRTSALNLTTGACAGGSADLIVKTYDYGPNSGPNNLLLRGVAVTASGETLRTCYTYDKKGNRISETQPMAGLSNCS